MSDLPLTNGPKDELKKFAATPSGRPSIVLGAKFQRGFIIHPVQILELLHDTQPSLPLPKDAKFEGIGVDDAGVDSKIQFYFSSLIAPSEHCLQMKPEYFFRILKDLADGLIPADAELDGIEISKNWLFIMLRVKSSHWGAAPNDKMLPMVHLRYDFKRLLLVDPAEAVRNELQSQRRIRIQ